MNLKRIIHRVVFLKRIAIMDRAYLKAMHERN